MNCIRCVRKLAITWDNIQAFFWGPVENHENLIQDRWCVGRDMNPGYPVEEAGVLPAHWTAQHGMGSLIQMIIRHGMRYPLSLPYEHAH
jgi:hypothetical protein